MKILIAFLMLASFCFSSEIEHKVFEVSKVKSDKKLLKLVFKYIQETERIKRINKVGGVLSFKVLQIVNKKAFLVTIHGNPYYLITLEKKNVADGEVLKEIWFGYTNETKTYTTVLDAKKTVRVLREVNPPQYMSKKEFVTRLKAGETWTFDAPGAKIKCKTCRGHGTTRKMGKKAVKCRECEGRKFVEVTRRWLVKW